MDPLIATATIIIDNDTRFSAISWCRWLDAGPYLGTGSPIVLCTALMPSRQVPDE